jgi:hypothetical protein
MKESQTPEIPPVLGGDTESKLGMVATALEGQRLTKRPWMVLCLLVVVMVLLPVILISMINKPSDAQRKSLSPAEQVEFWAQQMESRGGGCAFRAQTFRNRFGYYAIQGSCRVI